MSKLYRFHFFFIILAVVLGVVSSSDLYAWSQTQTFNIGVLARRGGDECLREWSPTARYLETQIPGTSFKITPLTFEEVTSAVKNELVDFIVVNPVGYVELQNLFGVSRMTTIKRAAPDGYFTLMGGVIFCRTDRDDIASIRDLKGKSFMAVDPTSFGGWIAAWRELLQQGIDPQKDFAQLLFEGTHDNVVYAVRDGKVDAGTIATPIMEKMIKEGKISQDTFKIINKQVDEEYPYLRSTRLYPEWPFAKLKHTSAELAEKVAVALLSMPTQNSAALAAQIVGWTVPHDYGTVEECMKELKVGIYKDYGKITLTQLLTAYRWQCIVIISVMTMMIGLLIFSRQINRKLRFSESALQEETKERKYVNTELVQLNDSLQQSRQQLANIIDFLPDATFVIDNDQKVIFWNRAMEEMTGIHKDTIIGQGDYAYTVPFYGVKRKQLLDLLEIQDEEVVSKYQYIKRKGGTLYAEAFAPVLNNGEGAHFWATAASLYDVHGNRAGAIESIRDITEQKQIENEKEKLKNHLLQAQKMEAIGTLAGGIAHDFNNILSAILGFTEIARDASPPGSFAVKSLDKVLEAGQRAATLVKQILAFSRQADIERVPLNLAHIVKEAINLLRPSLPSTIAIKQLIDTATRPINANPTQIHQILINLCTNASHAMELTGGTLEVSLKDCELFPADLLRHSEVHPGNFVVLSVSDTGTGIESALADRIFDPYFTTKKVGKGNGMGLAIVHGIVTGYGGCITYENNLGKGTVFHVYFPATDQEMAPAVLSVDVAPVGNERILLVDDEEMLVEMGKTILESLGYGVTVYTSSLEALAAFNDQSDLFDAVITDQTMPGMTGIELSKRMLEVRSDIPIILCTGYSTLVNEEQAKAVGIREFAMKPLTKKVIATLLRNVLEKRLPV